MKIVSENRFSGKTYFIQFFPVVDGGGVVFVVVLVGHLEVGAGGVLRQVEAGRSRRRALLGAEVRVAAIFLGRPYRGIIQLRRKIQMSQLQPADIGWPTGNGKKLSCSQAQLGQATGLAVA